MNNVEQRQYFLQQLNITEATYNEMIILGFGTVELLAMYDEATLKELRDDLKKPSGTEPVPGRQGETRPRTAFQFSTAHMKRLMVAASAAKYYQTIGRPLTAEALNWADRLIHFDQYLEGLKVMKDNEETPTMPKVSKNTTIPRWVEAFTTYTQTVLGARNIPLYYVIRPNSIPGAVDALLPGLPYGEEGGSVVGEFMLRANHTHALFRTDNEKVFYLLEEALRNTQYSATLSTFRRRRDGRGAWLALLKQHMGRDKWESEFKEQMEYLMTTKWTGKSGYALETFINKHRLSFTRIQRCSEHVTITIPSAQQRCTYVLDAIHNSDPQLQAAIARCRTDTTAGGLMEDFESLAAVIIPADPVSNGRQSRKKLSADIGAVSGSDLGITRGPKTGVDIRYYNSKAWAELSKEEREECLECRKANEQRGLMKDGKQSGNKKKRKQGTDKANGSSKRFKKQMEVQIAAYHAKHHGGPEPDSDDDRRITKGEVKQMIAAAEGNDASVKSSNATASQKGLKSILKRDGRN